MGGFTVRFLPTVWRGRLSEITTAGYQPNHKHGVVINIAPLDDAEVIPEVVKDKLLQPHYVETQIGPPNQSGLQERCQYRPKVVDNRGATATMTRNEGHVHGEVAEFAVATHLVRSGCRVSYTHGQYKYDLVADVGDIADAEDPLHRVQVKKANQDNEKPWKYRIFTDRYEPGQVDLFAGYIVEKDAVFYTTFDEVGPNEFRINTKGEDEMIPENAERANLLEEYTLQRALSNEQQDRP